MMFLILISIHIFLILLLYLLNRFNILLIERINLFIAFFLPYIGELYLLCIHFTKSYTENHKINENYEGISKHELDQDTLLIKRNRKEEDIVPLEDALIINDSETRRNEILDMLIEDSNKYIGALTQARHNDDSEVVHYASTAIGEASRRKELEFQKYEVAYKNDPHNLELLEDYIAFMKDYLDSQLLTGALYELNRNIYKNLLKNKLEVADSLEEHLDYVSLLIETSDMDEAEKHISILQSKYPHSQEVWLTQFKYYYSVHDLTHMKEMYQAFKKNPHYMSYEMKKTLEFWGGLFNEN